MTDVSTKGRRSSKNLACSAEATAYQRDFVKELKERVIDRGEPFAIVQAQRDVGKYSARAERFLDRVAG